jgi:hypothetical protein
MSDRDWEKELAKIDKQLASLPDEALVPAPAPAAPAKPAPGAKPAKPAKAAAPAPAAPAGERPPRMWAMYARLSLAVALGGAMVLWPYEARCGLGLAAYLAAVGVVVTSGIWSAVWTWRHRASRAHVLSMLIVLWGLILGAMEVLPRVGYAKPDLRHPTTWQC